MEMLKPVSSVEYSTWLYLLPAQSTQLSCLYRKYIPLSTCTVPTACLRQLPSIYAVDMRSASDLATGNMAIKTFSPAANAHACGHTAHGMAGRGSHRHIHKYKRNKRQRWLRNLYISYLHMPLRVYLHMDVHTYITTLGTMNTESREP